MRHDAGLTLEQRDRAVHFIELVAAVDGIPCQARADAGYFAATCGLRSAGEARAIEAAFLKAYRWQYIHSGAGTRISGKCFWA